jgi:hypothetical protein
MKQLRSHWTDFYEIWYLSIFFGKPIEKFQLSLKSNKNNGYFKRRLMTIYENISLNSSENEKCFRQNLWEKNSKQILCSIIFSPKSCSLWDNMEKFGTTREATDDNITRHMRFACWITTVTHTPSKCVILIVFSRQQWLRERSFLLRYTYITCLVEF